MQKILKLTLVFPWKSSLEQLRKNIISWNVPPLRVKMPKSRILTKYLIFQTFPHKGGSFQDIVVFSSVPGYFFKGKRNLPKAYKVKTLKSTFLKKGSEDFFQTKDLRWSNPLSEKLFSSFSWNFFCSWVRL